MTLLTSGLAIAGACAVLIPIIIHMLFRQRRKPIEWAAMRFLLEAFRRHKRRLRVEQWLLLAVRCLIPLLLGLALAQPLLQGTILAGAAGNHAVYLIIDNGLTSGASGSGGQTALKRHIERATGIIRALRAGDSVGVITAARPARSLLIPPSTDHGAVVDLISALEPAETPADLSAAFTAVRSALEDHAGQRESAIYLLSEFRTGSVELDSPPPPALQDLQGVKLFASAAAPETAPNVQVTAIEPVRYVVLPNASDGSGQVTVRLRRFGPQLVADVSRVKLVGENLPALEPQVIQWAPGQADAQAELNASFALSDDGAVGLSVSIDNDGLNADNQRFTVIEARRRIRVLLIDRRSFGFEGSVLQLTAGQWIRRALEPHQTLGGTIEIVEVEPAALDLADIRAADAAILPRPDLLNDGGWSILGSFVRGRGLVIITPPGEINVHQWTERLGKDLGLTWPIALEPTVHEDGIALAEDQPSAEITRLISSDLADLSRPVLAYRVLSIDRQALSSGQVQPLLLLADGSPLAIAGTPLAPAASDKPASTSAAAPSPGASGLVIYLAVAPELAWTTLPSKPLMVPLFNEFIRQGLSVIRGTHKFLVGEQPVLQAGPAAVDLIGPRGQRIALDRQGRPQQPLELSGLYSIVDQSSQRIGGIAANIEPRAGQTDAQSQAAVNAWLSRAGEWETFDLDNAAASVGEAGNASQLAGVLLLIVLVLALLETLLARWFSHAFTGPPQAAGPEARVSS